MFSLLRPSLGRAFLPRRSNELRRLSNFAPATPDIQVTSLPNGVRVATSPNNGQLATVGVWIDAGSAFETDSNNGVAHFLEHMVFKGTNKRSRHDIDLSVESKGALLNAYTSREHTVYYSTCFREDVPFSLDMLSDLLQNPKLAPELIESERGTILREKEEVENIFEEYIYDHVHAAAYQGSPHARTILGTDKNIKTLTREQLRDYINTHYTGSRTIVVGTGAVDHSELVKEAERQFSNLPQTQNNFTYPSSNFVGSQVIVQNDDMHELHVALAVQSVGHTHQDNLIFHLLTYLIGEWNHAQLGAPNAASRLGEIFALEKLGHSVKTFNISYHHTGLFGLLSVIDPHRADDGIYEMCNELQRLGHQVNERELERAKNQAKASYLYSLDSNFARAEEIGRHLLNYGRHMTPAEYFERLDRITIADVKRVADKYFSDVCPVVVALGNPEQLPDYNQIRGWMYWNRL